MPTGVSQEVSSTEGAGHQFGASAPGYTMMTPAAEPLLDDWRGNLAMLAANRTAASMEIASKLGDRLLKERNDVSCIQLLNSVNFDNCNSKPSLVCED